MWNVQELENCRGNTLKQHLLCCEASLCHLSQRRMHSVREWTHVTPTAGYTLCCCDENSTVFRWNKLRKSQVYLLIVVISCVPHELPLPRSCGVPLVTVIGGPGWPSFAGPPKRAPSYPMDAARHEIFCAYKTSCESQECFLRHNYVLFLEKINWG